MENENMLRSAAMALQTGNPGVTESLARAQLAAGGDNESWMVLLGLALYSQGRLAEVVDLYAALTRRYPKSGIHWGNLGTMLREAGRFEEAEAAYCQAIVLDPTNPSHLVNVGMLLSEVGNHASARVALLQAIDRDSDSAQARIHGALICFLCSDRANARRLISNHPDWLRNADLVMQDRLVLARVFMLLGMNEDAERTLFDALPNATPHETLLIQTRQAAMHERLNRLDEARRIIDLLPDPASLSDVSLAQEITNVRANLAMRDGHLDGAKSMLEDLAEQSQTRQAEASMLFALAKVCDKQGDPAGAMQVLEQAHAAQVAHSFTSKGLSIAQDSDPLVSKFPPLSTESFAAWPQGWRDARNAEVDPIFIVGFPRSGTTMLEQMLDATPKLRSMDEREFLESLTHWMRDRDLPYPEGLGELSAAQCDEMRSNYRASVAKVVSVEPGERLVDKNPLSMLILPMICRLFPDAPIILALRHPCDVVLSCYMQHFDALAFVDLCSNLERLSQSYVHAMRFWIHHENLLRPNVLHLRYEDLLSDFDGHSSRIGKFLGIEDVAAMQGFHEHARQKGYISTPSYHQVTQPMNSSAVGRWRKYENYFQDALPILRPIMEHWGYGD
ncbi:MAG TPA: sulfotransferase [Xanthomonadaceae bacterium]|nr:sulfotransferase [Xanthomonadaceae bacterium]